MYKKKNQLNPNAGKIKKSQPADYLFHLVDVKLATMALGLDQIRNEIAPRSSVPSNHLSLI